MLSVHIGEYHPSLEYSFVNTIQTLKKDDPFTPLAVVAPTNLVLTRLQKLLVHGQADPPVNVSFMNFSILASEICRWSGTDTGQIIQQPIIYEYLIEGLLKEQKLRESLFKNTQSLSALARALFQTLQDLLHANVDAGALEEAVREGFVESHEISRVYGIVRIYRMFKQKLRTLNISSYSGLYHLATGSVQDSKFLKGFRHILVYGFYDLTGSQQDFFEEIFRSYPTIVFMPYQKKHKAFSYIKPFFESFILRLAHDVKEVSQGDTSGFTYLMDPASEDNTQEAETPVGPQMKNVHVRIVNASGKRDEVWAVAKEILKLVDEGYKMEEIGVVARTLDLYTDTIKEIFHENYIPFLTSSQEPLGKYPLVRFIRQLLLLKRENYYRPMVIELLSSPYFRMPALHYKEIKPRPDLWDILSRKMGIRSDITCWLSRLKQAKLLQFPEPADGEEVEKHSGSPEGQVTFLENILGTLSKDLSSLPEKASWKDMSHRIVHLLQTYVCIPSEGITPEDKKRDFLILDKVSELLCSLQNLGCLHEGVTQDHFIDIFIEACRQEGLPVGLENDRGVHVLDALSSRGIPFRVLFIIGLNEKIFPRAIFEEPFLRDTIRRGFSEILGNYIPERLRGFEEERLLFYFLLNAARERLYLFYERSDETGRPKIPSHYLLDIIQRLRGTSAVKEGLGEKSEYEVYVYRGIKEKLQRKEISLLTPKEIGIRMALSRIDLTGFKQALGRKVNFFTRAQSALTSMESYKPFLTAHDGIVGDVSAWWDVQVNHGFSPTALESFGICPFGFFMGKVLKLTSLEVQETVETLASVDLGNLYHGILMSFYDTLIRENYFDTGANKQNTGELLGEIAQNYFQDIERQIPIPYPVVWEVEKEKILAFLVKFISSDIASIRQTGYIPAYLEEAVKLYPQFVPFNQAEGPKIAFRGKIDRIDLKVIENTISFRVIDYKSGKFFKENLVRSAIRGQKLQLPLYIVMAEHLLSEKMKKGCISQNQMRLESASFIYIAQSVENKKEQKGIPEISITGSDWKDCERQCWATLQRFFHYMRNGIFPISPAEGTQKCEWCEFSTVCRRGNQSLRFRLERDIRLKEYREIMGLKLKHESR